MRYGDKRPEMRKKFRSLLFQKCDGRCGYCGDIIEIHSFHIDHIIPKRRYKSYNGERYLDGLVQGNDDISNLLPVCESCNCSKSDFTVDQFRQRIKDKLNILNRNSSEYRIAKRYGLILEISDLEIQFYFEKILQNG